MKLETCVFQNGTAWSVEPDTTLDSPQTLLIIFGAPEYYSAPGVIQELLARFPNSHALGCSTAGEIFGTAVADASLSVAVVRFENTRIKTAYAPVCTADESYEAGRVLATQLAASDLRAVFVLSDGLSVNGSDLVRGINATLPAGVVVTGGLASDAGQFTKTWVLSNGQLQPNVVSAVGLYGDRLSVRHGSKGGWDIFGPPRLVTRSKGSVLYELDGKPALELYKMYLGELAAGLPATALRFPLALRDGDEEKSIVRTVVGVDEHEQSVTFAGDIPQGHRAQLMKANFDRLIDGAAEAARLTVAPGPGEGPYLSIAISCIGRRLVLGQRSDEELEAVFDILPPHTQQIGFYSNGEISPYATGHCDLHNQTMTLTLISEN